MPPARAPLVEKFGTLDLMLGGKNGYIGVRGGQGPEGRQFQGYTPRKSRGHFTKNYDTAQEAAIGRALIMRDRENGDEDFEERKPRKIRKDKVRRMPYIRHDACDMHTDN